VADSSPTRPPDGDIAGLSQFKQVLVFCVPSDDEAATREGDLRPLARESDGLVNWARGFSEYTWRHGLTRAKDFLMYAVGGDAPGSKTSAQIMEKCRWSTQVKLCVARYTKFLEHEHSETSSGVKIETQTILGPRPAIQYPAAASRQRLHEVT
jgi:hypothetical protein